MTQARLLLCTLIVAACKSTPAGQAADGSVPVTDAGGDVPAVHDGAADLADAAAPDLADVAPPACPKEAPVPQAYPFTPIACSLRDLSAHLDCPYDITSGRFQGCHADFQCVCVSSQMLGVPPTCTWSPKTAYQCPDAGSPDASADAGPFACGSHTCAPGQYCVTRGGGPPPQCFPHADGGACPRGTKEGCQFSPFTGCEEVREPSFDCESLPASCPSQEPCDCICHLAPGPMGGCFLTGRQLSCQYP